MKKNLVSNFLLLTATSLLPLQGVASPKGEVALPGEVLVAVLVVSVLLLVVVALLNMMVNRLKAHMLGEEPRAARASWFRRTFMGASVSSDRDMLMDHEYDGIMELDNPTPPWFMFLFYGTLAFAVIYMVNFHVLGTGKLQEEEYRDQIALAEIMRQEHLANEANNINEGNAVMMEDHSDLSEGKAIFQKSCAACHGQEGQGNVGPNLADKYWIHGGSIREVFRTIKQGVPQKGMISWEKQLTPLQIQQVSSFILSLQGTNPPNPKEPQGVEIP